MAVNGNNEWKPEKLEDICAQITDGKHGDCRNEPDSGFYFLSCKDIANGKLNYKGARQITEADFLDTHRRTKFAPSDVLITNSGTIGRMALAPDNELTRRTTFQKSVAILKPIASSVEPDFLYYALQSDIRRLIEFAGGTAQMNLLLRDLRAFEVNVPPLPVQRRIAGILSVYDELIENSQRRIRLLEAMACALYREWFVYLRFPEHGSTKLIESPFGNIPETWKVETLDDVVSIITKGTTPTTLGRKYRTAGLNFVKAESIEESGALIESKFAKIDIETHELLKRSQLRVNDILFSIAGVIGRVCIVPNRILPANTNQALAIIRSDTSFHVPYLYMTLRDEVFKSYSFGRIVQTAQANISLSELRTAPLVLPSKEVLTKFNSLVEPLLLQIQIISEKIQNLRRTRDLLLPRLLSGQLQLSQVGQVAKNIIPLPVEPSAKAMKKTTDEFVEAVLISQLTRRLASPQFPLGRLRYNKLCYFAHRKAEDDVTELYLKKAAGPYSPWAKYQGPENIALKNGYVKRIRAGSLKGLVAGENIDKIDRYLSRYAVCAAIDWVLTKFRYRKNDNLELLATVDFAALDLLRRGAAVTQATIKNIIATNKEWSPKLNRAIFSDENITRALTELRGLFPNTYMP